MKTAYIVDALRTPIGKYGGTLASVRPDDLAATVIRELLKRNASIDINKIEDVIFGAANQSGEDNRNVARMALLLAGIPTSAGGVTVNRLCASGLQAIMNASQGIVTGNGDVYIAGGVESMSRAPFVYGKSEEPFSRKAEVFDTTLGWRFINPALSKLYYPFSMGETAENVAEKWKISRQQQDEFGLLSQTKYFKAEKEGKFNSERVAVKVQRGKESLNFATDEYPRVTSLEKLAALKPAFREGGSVTAGNSSGINDGAAASFVVSEEAIKEFALSPMARVVSMSVAGVDPAYMGIGPVPATKKALQRAGLKVSDLGLIELNEAFASQSLACIRDLELDPS
ncbi:MAG TPA: acetyl-CoA C-acyltransferase, partial [Cyclobacteriaceae bacterium]|nr:acetyl-CoA C-acyltransferase [Cyclobacteriaceae bacterium]